MKIVQTFSPASFIWLLCHFHAKEVLFLLCYWVWALEGAAVLICSLPKKGGKRLVADSVLLPHTDSVLLPHTLAFPMMPLIEAAGYNAAGRVLWLWNTDICSTNRIRNWGVQHHRRFFCDFETLMFSKPDEKLSTSQSFLFSFFVLTLKQDEKLSTSQASFLGVCVCDFETLVFNKQDEKLSTSQACFLLLWLWNTDV